MTIVEQLQVIIDQGTIASNYLESIKTSLENIDDKFLVLNANFDFNTVAIPSASDTMVGIFEAIRAGRGGDLEQPIPVSVV